jgi:hypothetical protein
VLSAQALEKGRDAKLFKDAQGTALDQLVRHILQTFASFKESMKSLSKIELRFSY